jgi:hypothetical protein
MTLDQPANRPQRSPEGSLHGAAQLRIVTPDHTHVFPEQGPVA